VQFAASYQTSRHAGGDYYDVVPIASGHYGVMVADVSGHGAPAAIIMAMIRAAFHSQRGVHADAAAVLRTLNDHFDYLWDTEMFSTAIYATVDAGRRELRLACAGHPPPVLVRAGEEPRALAVDAVPPLLMMPLPLIPTSSIQLQQGDRVLFYTDGVTERVDRQGRMYDFPRLQAVLSEAPGLPPSALIRHVVDDLERFADGHEPDDDLTLVAVGFD
jgi:sigma-B regulation protein RsbU (phosphoserine phosphatase)